MLAWFVKSTHLNIIVDSNLTDFSGLLIHYMYNTDCRRTNSVQTIETDNCKSFM